MLLTLTLITVLLVVLALAGYLAAVAWALTATPTEASPRSRTGSRRLRGHTAPVDEKLATINGALSAFTAACGWPTATSAAARSGLPSLRGRRHVLQESARRVRRSAASRSCAAGFANPYDRTAAPAGVPLQLTHEQVEELRAPQRAHQVG